MQNFLIYFLSILPQAVFGLHFLSPYKCRLNPLKLCGLFATSDSRPGGQYNMLSGNIGIPENSNRSERYE